MKPARITIPQDVFFMSFLHISSFQERALEMQKKLVWADLELRLDWDSVGNELVLRPWGSFRISRGSGPTFANILENNIAILKANEIRDFRTTQVGKRHTSFTVANVSKPSKTRSTLGEASSFSVTLSVVLNAHSVSPTPVRT